MDLELAGKLCLVSGASRGIGRAIAHALAREGARVAAIARGQAGLDALLGELPGQGHAAIAADVTTAAGADAAVDGCVQALGGIDAVVTNVGKSFARDAQAMDDADLAASLDMNLWSAARIAQRAVPRLIERGGGSITMIASIWGREAGGAPGYNVAKAGVIALAKALARDYAKHAIRVNSIAPGSILFPGGGWDRRRAADPAGIAAFVARELPFGRFGTPEEVADAVAFVASARARWITGACIPVDGGQARGF
ncbi:MAG TPA: SDR family oxidoreductase [Kofleriaceae bacterium]|jgi:3-oxoacyl-[acyl-carrier protein] reductase|nr:SDR family oxidoreductase [Kofleriaceae bacterium]